MAVSKKKSTNTKAKAAAVTAAASQVLEETQTVAEETAAPVAVTSAPARKYPGTVTVCMDFPSSINFEAIDAHGRLRTVTINGNATHLAGLDHGVLPKAGSYGMTFGVDGELWEAVEKKHWDCALFKNGLIFAVASKAEAEAEVEKRKNIRNGFEPIDPDKPI